MLTLKKPQEEYQKSLITGKQLESEYLYYILSILNFDNIIDMMR